MTVRVPIRGETLAWARGAFGIESDDLARTAGVKTEQYERFESGDVQPTLNQVRSIAHRLDRTLAFFLTAPPVEADLPATVDFRRAGVSPQDSKLMVEIKRADAHRQTLLDLTGHPERSLPLQPVTREDAEARGNELRASLGLDQSFVPRERQPGQVFNFWRALLESHGVLVFQTTRISLATFRGLSIHHDELPIILLNGADSANGKIFTLFHEIAHLANRTSGVCELEDAVQIEAVCNAFAANVLVPRPALVAFLRQQGNAWDVAAVAAHFKISSVAAAVRLRTIGRLSGETLEQVREKSDQDWEAARAKLADSDGFVPPATLRYRDLGPVYVNAVLSALQADRINHLDASYMLNARVPTIEKMQAEFSRRHAS